MSKEGYIASGLALLAVAGVVLQMMYPAIPLYIGWPIVVTLGIGACVLFRKGANKSYKKTETLYETPIVSLHPKSRLNWRDRNAINNIEARMTELHGHCDKRAMESEMLRGVSASDLIKKDCTICFKPRGLKNDDEL